MKKNIHPTFYSNAQVTCNCGQTFTVGSTKKDIKVDVCSSCHPFFTGKAKLVDAQGRVEKFMAKREAAKNQVLKKKEKKIHQDQSQKTLKEMLQGTK